MSAIYLCNYRNTSDPSGDNSIIAQGPERKVRAILRGNTNPAEPVYGAFFFSLRGHFRNGLRHTSNNNLRPASECIFAFQESTSCRFIGSPHCLGSSTMAVALERGSKLPGILPARVWHAGRFYANFPAFTPLKGNGAQGWGFSPGRGLAALGSRVAGSTPLLRSTPASPGPGATRVSGWLTGMGWSLPWHPAPHLCLSRWEDAEA